MLTQIPLDSHLKRHLAGGTAHAGPVEADADGAGGGEFDQFKVAPVGLDGRSDQVDHATDALKQIAASENGRVGVGHGG